MDSTIDSIHNKVRSMYEDYPYPSYPLWTPLRWQEAYQGTAHFTAHLGINASIHHSKNPRILIGGCGETQPYILRKIEPRNNQLDSVDISSASIRRAKIRLLLEPKSSNFFNQDLDSYLIDNIETYDHIDCYGVLHHLANPTYTLDLLYQSLKPGGTLRIMVYNDHARAWIFQIKRALILLGFDPNLPLHIKFTQEFLKSLSYWLPNIQTKLRDMGASTVSNHSRLVDTFFHAREARIQLADWFQAIKTSGFEVRGLFDRYGELDDLVNPLWSVPSVAKLLERAKDKRFENNLELYLQKKSNVALLKPKPIKNNLLFRHYLRGSPSYWFQFRETQSVPLNLRQRIWWQHLNHVYKNQNTNIDLLIAELSTEARQRLARLGAISRRQVQRKKYLDQMLTPISDFMEKPEVKKYTPVEDTPLLQVIRAILKRNNRKSELEKLVIQRLNKAQTL